MKISMTEKMLENKYNSFIFFKLFYYHQPFVKYEQQKILRYRKQLLILTKNHDTEGALMMTVSLGNRR